MKNKMSFNDLLLEIGVLAGSQGSYQRLFDAIMELDDDDYQALKEKWDGAFEDIVDFILYIEG